MAEAEKKRLTAERCDFCGANLSHVVDGNTYSRMIGIEYTDGPERYDGTSEFQCPECEIRVGRWTKKVLKEGEVEKRYGGV
jgi:hypothetical protein